MPFKIYNVFIVMFTHLKKNLLKVKIQSNICSILSNYVHVLPVLNHPSSVNVSAVASGLFQYSLNTLSPLTRSSPESPSVPVTVGIYHVVTLKSLITDKRKVGSASSS